jgi:hypothetical protein
VNIEELLPAFAAGELGGDEREAVLQALSASPRLWDEVSRYQQLHLLLAAAAGLDVAPPSDLSGRIARQVAIRFYLNSATRLIGDLIGAYGRALVFYAGLR